MRTQRVTAALRPTLVAGLLALLLAAGPLGAQARTLGVLPVWPPQTEALLTAALADTLLDGLAGGQQDLDTTLLGSGSALVDATGITEEQETQLTSAPPPEAAPQVLNLARRLGLDEVARLTVRALPQGCAVAVLWARREPSEVRQAEVTLDQPLTRASAATLGESRADRG